MDLSRASKRSAQGCRYAELAFTECSFSSFLPWGCRPVGGWRGSERERASTLRFFFFCRGLLAEGRHSCNCILGGNFDSRGGWQAEGDLRVRLRRRDWVDVGYRRKLKVVWFYFVDSKFCFGYHLSWRARRPLNARGYFHIYLYKVLWRLVDITAGGDFLGLCDKKSSYKHMYDFGRLRSYGHFLIPVHALV